jgi:hypothetical protein
MRECTLILIDQQAGLAFGAGSIDRQVLLNNAGDSISDLRTREVSVGFFVEPQIGVVDCGRRSREWLALRALRARVCCFSWHWGRELA